MTVEDSPPLPTASEVRSYVVAQWDINWQWHEVFARFAERKGERATLVSVGDVQCSYFYITPQCTIQVTGRFPDGQSKTLPMFAQFERDKRGNLVEVIVTYHEVPKR